MKDRYGFWAVVPSNPAGAIRIIDVRKLHHDFGDRRDGLTRILYIIARSHRFILLAAQSREACMKQMRNPDRLPPKYEEWTDALDDMVAMRYDVNLLPSECPTLKPEDRATPFLIMAKS
jgi:hypothetical protein